MVDRPKHQNQMDTRKVEHKTNQSKKRRNDRCVLCRELRELRKRYEAIDNKKGLEERQTETDRQRKRQSDRHIDSYVQSDRQSQSKKTV